MVYLGLVLDLSTPPLAPAELVDYCKKVVPLLDFLEKSQIHGTTVNLNAGLSQDWLEQGQHDALDALRRMYDYGLVELTGTSAYHSILPLLKEADARRQVEHNLAIHRQIFGLGWMPAGLVPTELAYGPELLGWVPGLGFRWCLTDDPFYAALQGDVPYQVVPLCADMRILMRSRIWSRFLEEHQEGNGARAADALVSRCQQWFGGNNGYMIVTVTAKRFLSDQGRGYLCDFLRQITRRQDVSLLHLSQITERFPAQNAEVPPGSALTEVDDFWQGDFFAPWHSRFQPKQELLWYLSGLAQESVQRLQVRLDQTLTSATYDWVGKAPPPAGVAALIDLIALGSPERADEARAILQQLQT